MDNRKSAIVGCLSPGTPEWEFFRAEVRKGLRAKADGKLTYREDRGSG